MGLTNSTNNETNNDILINFGKHKGRYISEIEVEDVCYCDWLRIQRFGKNQNFNKCVDYLSRGKKYIYVLMLEDGCYYVGKTNNLERRFKEHYEGLNNGAVWTKKHKPIEIIFPCDMLNPEDENNFTFMYMKKFGIDKVRGGDFCFLHFDKKITLDLNSKIYLCSDSDVDQVASVMYTSNKNGTGLISTVKLYYNIGCELSPSYVKHN